MNSFFMKLRERVRKSNTLKFGFKLVFRFIPVVLRERIHRMTLVPYNNIEDKYHIIFIHIPKTAGKAIFSSLFDQEFTSHQSIINYRNYDQNKFNEYFKFAIVRNPWDRFSSAFFYLMSNKAGLYKTKEDHEFREKYLSKFSNITEFILALNENDHLRKTVLDWTHFIPQYKYICDKTSNNILDYTGKYEKLEKSFSYIKEKIGLEKPILTEKNRITKAQEYYEHYTPKTAKIIESIYKKDIDIFEYEFPYELLE